MVKQNQSHSYMLDQLTTSSSCSLNSQGMSPLTSVQLNKKFLRTNNLIDRTVFIARMRPNQAAPFPNLMKFVLAGESLDITSLVDFLVLPDDDPGKKSTSCQPGLMPLGPHLLGSHRSLVSISQTGHIGTSWSEKHRLVREARHSQMELVDEFRSGSELVGQLHPFISLQNHWQMTRLGALLIKFLCFLTWAFYCPLGLQCAFQRLELFTEPAYLLVETVGLPLSLTAFSAVLPLHNFVPVANTNAVQHVHCVLGVFFLSVHQHNFQVVPGQMQLFFKKPVLEAVIHREEDSD